jgi:hypothetical protein
VINRPSIFVIIVVNHADLPFRRLWLVLPSAILFGFATIGWMVLRWSTSLDAYLRRTTPFDARRLSRHLIQCCATLLCRGSYTLVDVRVPAEGVRVTIRVI